LGIKEDRRKPMSGKVARKIRYTYIQAVVAVIVTALLIGLATAGLWLLNRSTLEMFLGLAILSTVFVSAIESGIFIYGNLKRIWGSKKDAKVAESGTPAYDPNGVRDPGEPGIRGDQD
jgi:membrane protease YdiL (CAAX protease family)